MTRGHDKHANSDQNSTDPAKIDSARPRIIAIGASAGGLDPLEQFFRATDDDTGCCFIIIQHLSPDFRSMMHELLARHTEMPIERITDGLHIKPDRIYLNIPRVRITLNNDRFRLAPSDQLSEFYRPIDDLFGSIAEHYGKNAMGVILSGTGTDGSEGAQRLKQFGGQVLVQTPEMARFESMPRSIVDARIEDGTGDARELAILAQRWASGERLTTPPLIPVQGDPISSIIALIKRHTNLDFECYKPATVQRRVERRANLLDSGDINAYYIRVTTDPDELETLYSDMLIEVTSFFRDEAAFDSVGQSAMPALMEKLRNGDQLRVWVAGCASGEEAYSLGMLLLEHAEREGVTLNARIIATDAHGRSLDNANAGLFSRQSIHHVSPDRIQRFFDILGDTVRIKKELRKLLIFSTHDVIRDAPFTQIDLLSCRNLLIYLNGETQRHVLSKFHFALNQGGHLLLGPSESVGGISDEFDVIDSRWRIYKKLRNVKLAMPLNLAQLRVGVQQTALPMPTATSKSHVATEGAVRQLRHGRSLRSRRGYQQAIENIASRFSPPGFLLTAEGEVLHVFGDAGKLVPVNNGIFSHRLTDLVRGEFKTTVFTALQRSQESDFDQFEQRLRISKDCGDTSTYDLTLSSVSDPELNDDHGFLLLTICPLPEDRTDPALLRNISIAPQKSSDETAALIKRIHALEEELGATEETLQTTIEELETSIEELHSINEELFTVSAEHQRQTHELSEMHSEMDTLLQLSDIGTLHFDHDLRLKYYSMTATRVFDLSAASLSRSIDSIASLNETWSLGPITRKALETGRSCECEIDHGRQRYLLKAVPGIGHDNEVVGVLVAAIDITTPLVAL